MSFGVNVYDIENVEQGIKEDIEPGKNLGLEDVKRIKTFLRDFTVQSLVPWMEKNVTQWNDQVGHLYQRALPKPHVPSHQLAANRRGIAGRLFSAGRRYFGSRPSSPAVPNNQPVYDAVKGMCVNFLLPSQ